MLYRQDIDGPVVITQPAHAWVAGQMARAWGNDRFPRPEPWAEVCLGAERHDDGWLAWEMAPTLDPRAGQPYSFRDLPRSEHLAIWSEAGPMVLALGRYPALLVSLHGTGLYERYDPAAAPAEEVAAVQAYLARQQAFQASLLADLEADPRFAPHAAPEAVAHNRRLLSVWDSMSLTVCGGAPGTRSIAGVQTVQGEVALTMTADQSDPTRIGIDPWPFNAHTLVLRFEGRRLPGRFPDETALRSALAQAPWVSLEVRLAPITTYKGLDQF